MRAARLPFPKHRGFRNPLRCAQLGASACPYSFERYAKGGDDPKLKDWAGKTLPALQHHLEMAQDMNKNRK
jgi:putative membrane protein